MAPFLCWLRRVQPAAAWLCCALVHGACVGTIESPNVTGAATAHPQEHAGVVAGSAAAGASAQGAVNGGSAASGGLEPIAASPPPFALAAGMLRRLSRTQFRNAVRDVFGVEVDVGELDPDDWSGTFSVVGAASVVTSERGVEQYHAAIEAAVGAVFDDPVRREAFVGCTPVAGAADVCTRGFIQTLARRAWRRPPTSAEVDGLVALASSVTSELGSSTPAPALRGGAVVEGLRWTTVALFTSPSFLYRAELGAPSADGSLRFTGYEMASRLAFLIWNSPPDLALLDDAESGMLETAEGIRAAAERLLAAPAGREAIGAFAEEYMRLDRIATQAKEPTLFPEYGPALQEAMARDMRGTWETLAFDERGSVLDLFATTTVVANLPLARLYGLDPTGLDASTYRVLSLPADGPRLGILGKPAFLSQFANQKEGSPTLRGKFMRDGLLCTTIPPPPGDVDVVLEDPPADQPRTKRQRLEMHRTNPACSGCHGLMDPLGLPLETFDAIGRQRTTDHGLPIDGSGDFDGQPVTDARALALVIAASPTVARCILRKYYSYAVGHAERDVDGSVLNALALAFEASGFALRELVLDVVTHDAFASVAPQL